MSFRPIPLAAIFAFAIAQAPVRAGVDSAPRLLAYRMTVGKTLRYRLVAKVTGSTPLPGSKENLPLDGVIKLVYLATPQMVQPDGSADVEFKVDSFEATLSGIPLPLGVDDVTKFLNQTVTFSKTGEVKKVAGAGDLPFGVSIPGVDPKRLYTLIYPVVFQPKPVKPGESWQFHGELLGGQGPDAPKFTATLMPAEAGQPKTVAKLQEKFGLGVDMKLDDDSKPIKPGDPVIKTRKGKIEGSARLTFDAAAGRFTRSEADMSAKIVEDLVGKAPSEDEPKQKVSNINAKLTVELVTDAAAAVKAGGVKPEGKKEKP